MIWWLLFGVFLFILCAILIVLEILLPSFGVLTLCSLGCLVGGIWTFFSYGTVTGWVGIGIAFVVVPISLVMAYKYFPNTRFGKSTMLEPTERTIGDAIPDQQQLSAMLGKTGVVVSELRPVGKCDFDGQKIECVAESEFVEKGVKVEVIEVESSQVTVRAIETEE